MVQNSSWDVAALREGIVYMAAWQHIVFNVDSAVLERVIRDQGRTTQVDKYVLRRRGRRFRWSLLSRSRGT